MCAGRLYPGGLWSSKVFLIWPQSWASLRSAPEAWAWGRVGMRGKGWAVPEQPDGWEQGWLHRVLEGRMLVYGALTETLHRLLRELIGVAGTKRLSGPVSFLAVFCEPLEYRVLVLPHPLNVGFRLLQSLLQSPGARAKARVLVILLKLLQLPGKQSVRSGLAQKLIPERRGASQSSASHPTHRSLGTETVSCSLYKELNPSPLRGARSTLYTEGGNHSPRWSPAKRVSGSVVQYPMSWP